MFRILHIFNENNTFVHVFVLHACFTNSMQPAYGTWFVIGPLHTICRCLRTTMKLLFYKKKIEFRKMWQKEVTTHYLSYTSIFANVCSNWKYGEKSSLSSSKNRLLRQTHFEKKFFAKRLRIVTNHSRHSIRVS